MHHPLEAGAASLVFGAEHVGEVPYLFTESLMLLFLDILDQAADGLTVQIEALGDVDDCHLIEVHLPGSGFELLALDDVEAMSVLTGHGGS
jgi:hypothetical protein